MSVKGCGGMPLSPCRNQSGHRMSSDKLKATTTPAAPAAAIGTGGRTGGKRKGPRPGTATPDAADTYDLPPLAWLRAFEAAARHQSFTLAASELNLTQAAVSHQVRSLERYLGVLLFERLARTLRLTEIGTAYLLCPEAGTTALHREALMAAHDDDTAITNLFTGAPARGIVNRLMREIGPLWADAPAFPLAGAAFPPWN